MANADVMHLPDCGEFRQTLLARPPALVHGTALLLGLTLAGGLTWAALTPANLVVRATGHVRPQSAPRQVFIDFHGDFARAGSAAAVAEVCYRQGDEVRQGDVLIRMDTRRLESEMKKRQLTIQEGEKELAQVLARQEALAEQYERARAEARAELGQATQEIERARKQQAAEAVQAESELDAARQKWERLRRLSRETAVAPEQAEEARLRLDRAQAELDKARLPVLDEKANVLRRKLERMEKDQQLRRLELDKELAQKRRDVALARTEAGRLELERRQSVIRAPLGGVVTSPEVKVGDIPEPGKPVVEIAEQKGFCFEAAISSEDVARLKTGLEARVKLDAFDYQKYGVALGKVCFIAPDAKVIEGQRVARYVVKIKLESGEVGRQDEWRGRVKLGMAGQVDIVTEQRSLLSLLAHRMRQTFSLD
jgi:multidrug resistance efflux pump